jgi:hypothetical protein
VKLGATGQGKVISLCISILYCEDRTITNDDGFGTAPDITHSYTSTCIEAMNIRTNAALSF